MSLVKHARISRPLIKNAVSKKELNSDEFVEITCSDGRIHFALIYKVRFDPGNDCVGLIEGGSVEGGDVA